ncbi:Wzz/FepE/Etk N-terminal domain-containing protein [Kitasatospora sp. NPDC096204]|uniref:Wzz/FepE/Etk N-terminal domain-containing protein n=1 Tax=Kitasatospora sp. NPDC096204 TaxID=3364094 RepID=UPI003818372E
MTTPRRSARRLVRRWWPVVLAVPLGAAAGAGYAVVAHPSYSANAYVLVVAQNPGEAAIATNFAQAYGRLAGQPQVLAVAADETGHTRTELETLVHGTTSPDAPMIEITGTGRRPQDAAGTADAVARSLVAFANTSSKDTNVRLVTLAPAAAPDRPTTPSGKLDVAVGGSAGLLLGALVMMTRRRGGAGTPEADASPEAPRAEQAPEVPAATAVPAAAVSVAVPTQPRPRREEPVAAGPEAVAAPEVEGAKAASPKKESARTTRVKKESPKAEKKTDARTGDKADKQTGTESAAAEPAAAEQPTAEQPATEQPLAEEQPPAEEQAPAAGGQAPAAGGQAPAAGGQAPAPGNQTPARKKAPAGSGR